MTVVTDQKRSLFNSYASEFEKNYLLEPAGQRHLALYKKEREDVTLYWSQIKKAKQEGNQATDLILQKLLPYSNTRHNREKNYRISVAPAITKDLKKWFENAGWQNPDNWDNVANGLFDLVYGLIEKGDWNSLVRFEKDQQVSKGIKAGFITPTLYFLNPQYRIINNKTIDTINFLLDQSAIGRDLSRYQQYLGIINDALDQLGISLFNNADIFDSFCHWMCDKRLGGYARIEKTPNGDEEEEEEGIPVFEAEIEPQNHWEAIYYIVKAGNLLGFKTYIADSSKIAFEKKLGEIATLTDVPPILKSAPEISRVDAIWYRSTPPFFLFEVEDGGTMREALHRLYNAMAFDARFFVVSPIGNQSKFEKWVTTAPFKEFEERYNFRTYSDLFDFYKEVVKFISMRERFLRL
jgi:hypothetical protein